MSDWFTFNSKWFQWHRAVFNIIYRDIFCLKMLLSWQKPEKKASHSLSNEVFLFCQPSETPTPSWVTRPNVDSTMNTAMRGRTRTDPTPTTTPSRPTSLLRICSTCSSVADTQPVGLHTQRDTSFITKKRSGAVIWSYLLDRDDKVCFHSKD